MTTKKRYPKILSFTSTLCLLLIILNCGCIQDNKEDIPVMTMKQNANDNIKKTDNTNKTIFDQYKSFDDGDTIIIRDIISKSIYDQTDYISLIEFESLPGYPQAFEGDVSYKFQPGDKVDLTVHIQRVTFVQVINNETWTYDFEVFGEGWDANVNGFIPIPQKYLTKTNID